MPYSFNDARNYCASVGMEFSEQWAEWAGQGFERAGLTQVQVDHVLRLYIENQKSIWTPKNYSWRNRVRLAFYFLFR